LVCNRPGAGSARSIRVPASGYDIPAVSTADPQRSASESSLADPSVPALRSEADVVRTLDRGTYTLRELYAACERAGDAVIHRHGGLDRVQDGQRRWQRRVRGAVQALKEQGRAEQVERGVWAIEGAPSRPSYAVLVLLPRDPGRVELVLAQAAHLLERIDEPVDLVVADPPWGLNLGDGQRDVGLRTYRRNERQVVPGYVDVTASCYEDFTERWVTAAAAALRKGGYLTAITGPEQAPTIRIAAQRAGLGYANSIVYRRPFALRTTRRFAHAHGVISVLCKGTYDGASTRFQAPPSMPLSRQGTPYPLDWWPDIPKYERPGLLRYRNALPPLLVRRLLHAYTAPHDLVVDPFSGSGTTMIVCLEEHRRFIGGDVNPHALRFAMARVLVEHLHATRYEQLGLELD